MSDSTWLYRPDNNEWNGKENWSSGKVPTDKATFGESQETALGFDPAKRARVATVQFGVGAPSYVLKFGPAATSPALTITGEGVVNRSASRQSLIVACPGTSYKKPALKFTKAATAGGEDMFYCAGPATKQDSGGGIIGFTDRSGAGRASFVAWTGAAAPPQNSTVGGEVSFSDRSSADRALFTIYGSLGTDGDTFGNVVFHNRATAANGIFTNIGGTVSGGDGGNTQFYNTATAANGVFHNQGGVHSKANGGDVAFDGRSNGGYGVFNNYPAAVANANGGVTSFNNNPPEVKRGGASAGHGAYNNYGAQANSQAGGGHTEFTAKHGSPTAANGRFYNYGSQVAGKDTSAAGHTIFSTSVPTEYRPTAGNGTFFNHPALVKGAAAGFTEFTVYSDSYDGAKSNDSTKSGNKAPTAGDATLINIGGNVSKANGGYTTFAKTSTAANALLIAQGGINDGYGGRINFCDDSSGGRATVRLIGNGALELGEHAGPVRIAELDLMGGVISTQLGKDENLTTLKVSRKLRLHSASTTFSFWKKRGGGFKLGTPYKILTASNMSDFTADRFQGNRIGAAKPKFRIVGRDLLVTFFKRGR